MHNLEDRFSIWVGFAKWRKSFQIYSFEDRTIINLCTICKTGFQFEYNLQQWRNVFSDLHVGVQLSICVICANCTICKTGFQFEYNLQNEEMSFETYSLGFRTIMNLCNLCNVHNLQDRFSIWVQSAKWRDNNDKQ